MFLFVIWFFLVIYLFYIELCKFNFFCFLDGFYYFLCNNFDHQGLQSSIVFKFVVFFLSVFWVCGLLFPLFSPWVCLGFLFFFCNMFWIGIRVFTLTFYSFLIFFDEDHSWDWFTSLVMFFSHLLSFLMSGIALVLRISIIFLIGHFIMFSVLEFEYFFVLLFVIPVELFFAFLQSYIFLTLLCMFLLNMV